MVQNVSQGPWTVQVGAFTDVRRANEQAARVRSTAARLGLGEPRVRAITSSGRTLHAVQVGTFNSRVSADRARTSLGSSAVVTSLTR